MVVFAFSELVEWKEVETGWVQILLFVVSLGLTAVLCGLLTILAAHSFRRERSTRIKHSRITVPFEPVQRMRQRRLTSVLDDPPALANQKSRKKSRSRDRGTDEEEDPLLLQRKGSRPSLILKSRRSIDESSTHPIRDDPPDELNTFSGPAGPFESVRRVRKVVRRRSSDRMLTDTLNAQTPTEVTVSAPSRPQDITEHEISSPTDENEYSGLLENIKTPYQSKRKGKAWE